MRVPLRFSMAFFFLFHSLQAFSGEASHVPFSRGGEAGRSPAPTLENCGPTRADEAFHLFRGHSESLERYEFRCQDALKRRKALKALPPFTNTRNRDRYQGDHEKHFDALFQSKIEKFRVRYQENWGALFNAPELVDLVIGEAVKLPVKRVLELESGYGFNAVFASLEGEDLIEWISVDSGTHRIYGRRHPWFKRSQFFKVPSRYSASEAIHAFGVEEGLSSTVLVLFHPHGNLEAAERAIQKFIDGGGIYFAFACPYGPSHDFLKKFLAVGSPYEEIKTKKLESFKGGSSREGFGACLSTSDTYFYFFQTRSEFD